MIEKKEPMNPTRDNAIPAQNRLFFVDNLRIFLIILVIGQHTAITYGGPGSWYYTEPTQDMVTLLVFTIFCAVNQSFFMGFFFMISGYFTSSSYDRKGMTSFLKGRIQRLGIPLLGYMIFIDPLIGYILAVTVHHYDQSFWIFLYGGIQTMRGLPTGPLWFVETLLIFAFFYVAYRLVIKSPTYKDGDIPSNKNIALSLFILGVTTFFIRIWLPVGWNFQLLNLQFPYFPQYIFLFVVGIIACQRNWVLRFPLSICSLWLKIAFAGILTLPLMGWLGGAFEGDISAFEGGIHWQAFALALWESFVGVGMCIGLLVLFREKYNHQNNLKKALADNVYTVFIIHAPVLVFVGLALRGITIHPFIKFAFVLCVVISLCFLVSHFIIRRLPFAKKIL